MSCLPPVSSPLVDKIRYEDESSLTVAKSLVIVFTSPRVDGPVQFQFDTRSLSADVDPGEDRSTVTVTGIVPFSNGYKFAPQDNFVFYISAPLRDDHAQDLYKNSVKLYIDSGSVRIHTGSAPDSNLNGLQQTVQLRPKPSGSTIDLSLPVGSSMAALTYILTFK